MPIIKSARVDFRLLHIAVGYGILVYYGRNLQFYIVYIVFLTVLTVSAMIPLCPTQTPDTHTLSLQHSPLIHSQLGHVNLCRRLNCQTASYNLYDENIGSDEKIIFVVNNETIPLAELRCL